MIYIDNTPGGDFNNDFSSDFAIAIRQEEVSIPKTIPSWQLPEENNEIIA